MRVYFLLATAQETASTNLNVSLKLPIYRPAVCDLYECDERFPEPSEHTSHVKYFAQQSIQRFRYAVSLLAYDAST